MQAVYVARVAGVPQETWLLATSRKTDFFILGYCAAINYPAFSDDDAADLVALQDNIVGLNLGRTALTDLEVEHHAQLTVLRQMYLEYTTVTEKELAALEACQQLEYLNLSGTAIGDTGIGHLKALPALTNFYVFGTQVSAESIADLQQSKPDVVVNTGGYTLEIDL